MSTTPQISGTIVGSIREVMEARLQREGYARMLASLPENARQSFTAITPIGWMPVAEFNLTYGATAAVLNKSVHEVASDLARESTSRTLHTVWRVLLRFTTDSALTMRAPVLYAKTFDTGQAVSVFENKQAKVSISGWPGMPDLSVLTLGVGVETVFRVAGRAAARVHSTRSAHGAEYSVTW